MSSAEGLTSQPAFMAYAIMTLVLWANLIFLWLYSGVVRGGTKTSVNPEDAQTVSKGAAVVDADPPEVARVLRAHRNAEATIYPFLFLSLIYVLLGPSPMLAGMAFAIFTVARLAHSVAYLKGLQPWRTIFYSVGGLSTLVVVADFIRLLV